MATAASVNAQLYLGITTASPVSETFDLSIETTTDTVEDTAHGDTIRSFIPTLASFDMSIGRHWDSAAGGGQLQTWALARQVLKFYLYPDRTAPTIYWYGSLFLGGGGMSLGLEDVIDQTFTGIPAGTVGYQHP